MSALDSIFKTKSFIQLFYFNSNKLLASLTQ